eukprot:1780309-Pyramimonas_sp.AAC.1
MTKKLMDNPTWSGCLGSLPQVQPATFEKYDLGERPWGAAAGTGSKGLCPWLASVKKEVFKYGPKSWPLPGVGCFVTVETPMVVELLAIEPLLTKGITLTDATGFLTTDD